MYFYTFDLQEKGKCTHTLLVTTETENQLPRDINCHTKHKISSILHIRKVGAENRTQLPCDTNCHTTTNPPQNTPLLRLCPHHQIPPHPSSIIIHHAATQRRLVRSLRRHRHLPCQQRIRLGRVQYNPQATIFHVCSSQTPQIPKHRQNQHIPSS